MVTKLKSRDNLKYLILVILICICSTVLLSRYGSFYEAGEKAQKEKADSMENVISDMGDGLAIGNCILDNEISGGREQSELLEEYGMSQFNLLKKYMEYGAFDRNGESLLKSTPDSVATRLLSDSDSIYGIRVAYTYDADGELSDIEVSGSRLTPEEEYEAEQSFLADVRFMEDAYGIELSGEILYFFYLRRFVIFMLTILFIFNTDFTSIVVHKQRFGVSTHCLTIVQCQLDVLCLHCKCKQQGK